MSLRSVQSNSNAPSWTVRLEHPVLHFLALCLSDIFPSPPLFLLALLEREKQREREREIEEGDFYERGGEDGVEF
jgi:hypothetical protein